MNEPLLDHVGELFYSFKLSPRIIDSPMIGNLITDQLNRKWRIINEKIWTNLNVSPSDQDKEGLPCRDLAVVDVMKARLQIAEDRNVLLKSAYRDGIIGDKLSALHLHTTMELRGIIQNGHHVFDTLKKHGTTTRTEYNTRLLYSLRVPQHRWLSNSSGLNISGSTHHSLRDFQTLKGSNVIGIGSHFSDGPMFGSFFMHKSSVDHLKTSGCFFLDTNEEIEDDNHGMMVFGSGKCKLLGNPLIVKNYWVARNSWGPDCPLVVRGSVECLDTMTVPQI